MSFLISEIKNKEVRKRIMEMRRDGVDLEQWFYWLVLNS